MRLKSAAVAWALATILCFFAYPQEKPKQQNTYEALVERVKRGDQSVDFLELRLAYAESPNYSKGTDTDRQKKAMTTALNGKDFASAIKNADIVLASNYVDMDAHYAEYIANNEIGKRELAEFHKFVLQGLLRSITSSGNGKTPETAYQVIEVHEEYVVLRFMGFGFPASQSYLHKNGHAYDEMTIEDPKTKQDEKIYFNVDIPAKHGL